MNFREAKKYSRHIVAAYYGDGHVFYAEQKMTKKPAPYVTVKFNGLGKSRTKITKYDKESQCNKDYWQANTKMELNLYTLGKNIAPDGMEEQYENTAVEEIDDFVKYLVSDAISDSMVINDVVIALDGNIHDLTFLLHESQFRYRAMAEFVITFTDSSYEPNLALPDTNGGAEDLKL